MSDLTANTDCNALTFYNRQVPFKILFSEIDRIAGYLLAAGIKKGDCVCICLPNIPHAVITLYAVNKVGAIANMVHPIINSLGLRRKLAETKSKIVFLAENLYHNYADDLDGLDIIEVICSPSDYLPFFLKTGYNLKKAKSKYLPFILKRKPFDFKMLKGSAEKRFPVVSGCDIAAYMHSGGTTGDPKTIMLTNRNINELASQLSESLGHPMHEGVAVFAVLPMFHGFGLAICFHLALATRARVVLIPHFKAEETVKVVKRQKINMIIGVPQIYQKLIETENFRGKALANITSCFCGGDKLDIKTKEGFEAILRSGGSSADILEGYGLTETVSVCAVNRFTDKCADSIGKALVNTKIIITDENDIVLPPYGKGQICVTGDTVMAGYLNDKKTTQQTFFKDANGVEWLKTGDIGYLDDKGFLFFINRKKRLIIISGVNVFPSEIEKYADEVEGVKRSCAVEKTIDGKRHIVLYVVLKTGVFFDAALLEKIINHLKRNLDKWSQPKMIVPIKNLPLTQLGKIDIRALENLKD